jgi:hypothetical protein
MSDAVNHPTHYTKHGEVECIAAIRASMSREEFCGYLKGNTMKYLWRYRDKGGMEDLKKAGVYHHWLVEAYVDFCQQKGIKFDGESPVSSI